MSRYTRANRVRSHVLYHSASVSDAATQASTVVASWAVPDDIYVIGWKGMVELASSLAEATGEESVTYLLTRASISLGDGEMACLSNVRQEEATAGSHVHDFLCLHDGQMYPEGCGFEMDEGDYLNLIAMWQITKARIIKGWFQIFYVEK